MLLLQFLLFLLFAFTKALYDFRIQNSIIYTGKLKFLDLDLLVLYIWGLLLLVIMTGKLEPVCLALHEVFLALPDPVEASAGTTIINRKSTRKKVISFLKKQM